MKKKIISILILAMCIALSGCGGLVPYPDITEEEEELITEYAAGLILKYDTKFAKGNLIDEDELAQAEAKEKEARAKERQYKKTVEEYLAKKEAAKQEEEKQKQQDSTDASGNGNDDSTASVGEQPIDNIASFYGIDGFNVTYTGYELCDSYSDSIMMDVDASAGKQLIVLGFDVSNVSNDVMNFDMFYKNPAFYLTIDGGKKVKMQGTLMFDDMSSFAGEIGAGNTQPMVLIFEIDENINSIGNMVLTAKNGSEKGSITLQ